jgi:hypothetical protein
MTKEELIEYFNEHILYELLMLRYAKLRLTNGQTQILWNAMFATFNVSARNLYEFLNNKGSKNEVNVHDYQEYYGDFVRHAISDITGTLQLINEQCFHMGVKRPKVPDKKVNMSRIQTMFDWIESNIDALISNFDDDFRAELQLARANPTLQPDTITTGPTGPAAPAATNHVTFSGTQPKK